MTTLSAHVRRFGRVFCAFLLVTLLGAASAPAQIATWTFENTPKPTTTAANLTANPVTFGDGTANTILYSTGNPAGLAYSNSGWPTTSTVGADQYIQFALAPGTNNAATITSIAFDVQRSASGPATLFFRSSADNFVSNLATFTSPTAGTYGTLTYTPTTPTTTNTTIIYRIYAVSATASSGTLRIDNLIVNGSVNATTNATTNLISTGQDWKYLVQNTTPANFSTVGFDDSGFSTGSGPIGYGAVDSSFPFSTSIGFGGDANNKFTTTYFRKTFTVSDVSAYKDYTLRLRKDDGAVVYLNGVEVKRENMPATSTAATFASANSGDPVYINYSNTILPNGAIRPGSNVFAVEIHQATASSSDIFFDLELVGNVAANTLAASALPLTGTQPWKVLDNGTDQGTTWQTLAFDDQFWKQVTPSGTPARMGYGETGDANIPTTTPTTTAAQPFNANAANYVSAGVDATNKFVTTYFRKKINIPSFANADLTDIGAFDLRVMRDDGVVVYVNGAEVYRNNMPAGAPGYTTLASANVSGADETSFDHGRFPASPDAGSATYIPRSAFVQGDNIIAVEVHQDAVSSSDLTMNLSLSAVTYATLPVTLGYFGGRMTDAGALLEWATAMEKDNAGFSILRGRDPVGLESIGTVASLSVDGNSLTVNNYQFVDANPLPGVNYYQLRQTDRDGTHTLSKIIALTQENQPTVVYPNPGVSGSKTRLSPPMAYDSYQLHDAAGRLVMDATAPGTLSELTLDSRVAGVYVLSIIKDGQKTTFRIVRQ